MFNPVQSIVSLIRALKFQPGLWVESLDPDLPPPPHSPLRCQSPSSSPSLLRSVPCPLIILCPVTHWCDHSFIHSYTHSLGKYLRDWSQLISLIHLLFIFTLLPKAFLVLNSLLSLYLSFHLPSSNLFCPPQDFFLLWNKRWFLLWKDFIMSLFHKSIRFSKSPFKLKKKKWEVNSDILQLT